MIGLLLLTVRELRSRFIILGLAGVGTFLWLVLAVAVNLDVVDGELEALRLFGQMQETEQEITVVNPETGEQEVHTFRPFGADPLPGVVIGVQRVVAAITFWVILFLGLFATGTLVASLQERGQVDLLLSKPISRARVLGGRLLGVGAAVGVLVLYVLGAVWLVMSLKSGVWNPGFLKGAASILLMFAVLYGVVAAVGVFSDSSALAMLVALGVLVGSLIVASGGDPDVLAHIDQPWRGVYVGLYYVLPNFPAATGILWELVGGDRVTQWYPLLSSVAFGVVLYGLAFWRFDRRDF